MTKGLSMPHIDFCEGIAKPSDLDLDFDMDGMTITSVCCCGQDVLVDLEGGRGFGFNRFWTGDDGPGNDAVMILTVALPSATQEGLSKMVVRLDGWYREGTPVHMCAAPNRPTTMIASAHDWQILPRLEMPALDSEGPNP